MGVSGCFNHRQDAAPVVQYAVKLSDIPDVYKVREGESLYTIAWQYDLDFRTIAANNALSTPDQIYPGQKLYLRGKSPKAKAISVRGKRPPKVQKRNQPPTIAAVTSRTQRSPTTITKKSQKPVYVKSDTAPLAPKSKWLKPVAGQIINSYSVKANDFNKGIDFSGRMNDKVLAAQAGKVVYSGTGLRGYGKLIIIKHNEMYLSAYAHNNKLLVSEGDIVSQGDQIARMGNTDSNEVKLHFQIRKNGHPVDPAKYL